MRRNRFSRYWIVAIPILLMSCGKAGTRSVLRIDNLPAQEEVIFTRWRILGPFSEKQRSDQGPPEEQILKTLYNNDYLSRFDIEESQADYGALSGVKSGSDFVSDVADTDGHVLDFGKILQVDRPAVAYAAREIESKGEQDVILSAEMQGMGLKMWLNNELVIAKDGEGSLSRLENIKPVHLKKGKNLLLAKVVAKSKYFRLIGRLMTIERARETVRDYGMNRIVKRYIVNNADPLELALGLERLDSVQKVEILDFQKNALPDGEYQLQENGKIDIGSLGRGLYYCRVKLPFGSCETEFYRGDVETVLSAYRERSAVFSSDERTRINLDALLLRYEHLLAPENKKPDNGDWQFKMVYIIHELESALRNLESGEEAFKDHPGRHLRGFRSRIDEQIAHYMVYVPPQYAESDKPIPLVVFVPYDQWPHRPFLKSVHVAVTDLVEHFMRAADRNGYAVLWTNGSGTRGGASLNQKGMTDILDTIGAVESDYRIDADRIYLWGSCAGARDALMLASRYPDKFAALGMVGVLSETAVVDRGDRVSRDHAKEWLKANSPIYCAENLSNIPISVLVPEHDEEITVEESAKYVEKCRQLGIQASLEVMANAYDNYYPEEPIRKSFEYYKGIVRNRKPARVQLSTWQLKYGSAYWLKINDIVETMKCARIKAAIDQSNTVTVETENIRAYEVRLENLAFDRERPLTIVTNGEVSFNGIADRDSIAIDDTPAAGDREAALTKTSVVEGPILHAFADAFIVVEGTHGSAEERGQAASLCQAFCKAWRDDYFQDCLHKTDDEITDGDIDGKNLILFGNDQTNSFIKRVIGRIPVKFSATGITVGDKSYQGGNLGARLVYPNPLNRNRYIVIIGGNRMTNLPFEVKCLAIEGWYDFMVWKPADADKSLIDIGYFDRKWMKIISLI